MVSGKSQAPLRFAALRRVSSEGQATQRHVSLEVQTQQIETAVQAMAGKIVGWYGGAEHATPGYEKKEIDRLLADAQRHKFDAFVCSDPDRWSRDNTKSKAGLDTFLEHGIRFFVRDTEQDLRDPNVKLFLGISAVIGEYFAANQKKKSINARILLAQQGRPGNACLPHGRIWDKESRTWHIDPEKQKRIQTIADRYLAGESLQKLSAEYQMNYSNLYVILTEGAGPIWKQTFYPHKVSARDRGEPVVIPTKVDRLLSAETMRAIKERLAANKTYAHGHIKNQYLLSRMVFCNVCGGSLSGYQTWKGHRYYRHLQSTQGATCQCAGYLVRADELEEHVILDLFDTFGNPAAIARAVANASGDMEKVREYQDKLARIDTDLAKLESGRQKILDLILKGTIADGQAEAKLAECKEREGKLQTERNTIAEFLADRPSPEEIRDVSKRMADTFQKLSAKADKARRKAASLPLSAMSYEDKRSLCELVFGGRTPDGRRQGIVIHWQGRKDWTFDIRGHLIDIDGISRLADWQKHIRRKDAEQGSAGNKGQADELIKKTNFARSPCGG
jgi:DNA invertase Pin-like site-specific DNA recombinase